MNTMLKLFLIAVMAMGFTAEASASDRSTQLMRERNVPPSVLADRVEACLNEDATGMHCRPEGSNATPAQYMAAINANPEGKVLVRNVGDLPKFLRGLKSGPFTGEQCLAGMNGTELAAYCRNLRAPHAGEVAWWHGDTFVLAGDCLNARVGYKATPLPGVVVVGQRPTTEVVTTSARDPYAGLATTSRASDNGGGCQASGERWFGVVVFEASAAQQQCAVETMLPAGGYFGRRQNQDGGIVGTYHDANRFSRTCGVPFRKAAEAGQIGFSSKPHPFRAFVKDAGGEHTFFRGTVTGNTITAVSNEHLLSSNGHFISLPEQFKTGDLVIQFDNPDDLRTPAPSGLGERVENVRSGCTAGAFYGIDADSSNTVADSTAYNGAPSYGQ